MAEVVIIAKHILVFAVAGGTAILIATAGAILTERSGVNQIGIEGLMLVGALTGFIAYHSTDSLLFAVVMAFISGVLLASVHGFISVYIKGNQIVSGLAVTMFGIGVTSIFGKPYLSVVNKHFSPYPLPLLSKIPFIGDVFFNQHTMVYLSYLLILSLWLFLRYTKWGLFLKTCGENPAAADTSGVNVNMTRFIATSVGGGISALGGAYLSLFHTPFWAENMTGGAGWIAVALVIFSGWSFIKAVYGAYFFGALVSLQQYFQLLEIQVSPHILNMLPYLATVAVLSVTAMRKNYLPGMPAMLGTAYSREERG